MAITYNNLYMDIRQLFRDSGIDAATLEARELVCYASGKTREQLSRDARLYVPQLIEERTRQLVARHLAGEPVAYLIGEWEFYGLPLDINESVLIPRADTEVLAAQAIDYVKTLTGARILDLCAGSGCVGLAVAKYAPGCHVVLGEIDEGALRICRQNVRRNGLTTQVMPYQVDALARPPVNLGEFDCIVCNPPYIPDGDIAGLDVSVREYEPLLALRGGADGLDFYRAVCDKWRQSLRTGGRLYFEVGVGQADAVLRIMRAVGFGDIQIVADTGGIPRVVFGTLLDSVY
ncbi:MAG: peptide chain release factor N(5)-glutamine methyltransferase [Ruminococcaceae bacterium]|jgi:release factor glutamine methyltransferase|nr:peptide chain release factor N(5)-glutamine methyltransferase [Oscillospiraceae bacterium]